MNSATNYGVTDGHGNQVSTGLMESGARKLAQRRANEVGESFFFYPEAYDCGTCGDSCECTAPDTEVEPDAVEVEADDVRETDTGVDGALDVTITLTIGAHEVEGDVTLVRHEQTGEWGAWGGPDHWVSSNLLASLKKREDFANVLAEIAAVASTAIKAVQ